MIVALVALGIASLRTGATLASLTQFVGFTIIMAYAILAFVAVDQPRAFATGFTVPVLIYGLIVFACGSDELDPYEGRLPTTTHVLRYAHQTLVTTTWTNLATGKVDPDYDPSQYPAGGYGGGGFVAGGPVMILDESPDRPTFMSVGHLLIALMLGWIGGKFAVFTHRNQRSKSLGREFQDSVEN